MGEAVSERNPLGGRYISMLISTKAIYNSIVKDNKLQRCVCGEQWSKNFEDEASNEVIKRMMEIKRDIVIRNQQLLTCTKIP